LYDAARENTATIYKYGKPNSFARQLCVHLRLTLDRLLRTSGAQTNQVGFS
jgi:hypothetical protein